jgi:hypothetical protein
MGRYFPNIASIPSGGVPEVTARATPTDESPTMKEQPTGKLL